MVVGGVGEVGLEGGEDVFGDVVDVAGGDFDEGVFGGSGRGGDLRPGQLEQAVGGCGELGADGAGDEALDRDDGGAVLVDGVEAQSVAGLGRQPDAQGPGLPGVQGDAVPGERQRQGVRGGRGRVQRGVQQRRVQAETVLRNPDFGVEHLTVAPRLGEALEHRAVLQSALGERDVQLVHVERRAGGGPGEFLGCDGGGAEGAGGVEGPVGVGAGVDGHGVVDDLDLDLEGLGEQHRGFDDQFVQGAEAGEFARVQGQVDQGRAGDDDRAAYLVVREP
ncbi:hypothetical protein Sgri01_07233 [Streptomyces griseus]